MFWKLLRYEVKTSAWELVMIEGVALLVYLTLLLPMLLDNPIVTMICAGFAQLVAGLGAVIVVIWLLVHYYRTVYGQTGYFTASLPVHGSAIWGAKILWASVLSALALLISSMQNGLVKMLAMGQSFGDFMEGQFNWKLWALIAVAGLYSMVLGVFVITLARTGWMKRFTPGVALALAVVGVWMVSQVANILGALTVPLSMKISSAQGNGPSGIEGIYFQYTSLSDVIGQAMQQADADGQAISIMFPAGSLVAGALLLVCFAALSAWFLERRYTLVS